MLKYLFLLAPLVANSPVLGRELPNRPDPELTLGAVLTTDAATVCRAGYAKKVVDNGGGRADASEKLMLPTRPPPLPS